MSDFIFTRTMHSVNSMLWTVVILKGTGDSFMKFALTFSFVSILFSTLIYLLVYRQKESV